MPPPKKKAKDSKEKERAEVIRRLQEIEKSEIENFLFEKGAGWIPGKYGENFEQPQFDITAQQLLSEIAAAQSGQPLEGALAGRLQEMRPDPMSTRLTRTMDSLPRTKQYSEEELNQMLQRLLALAGLSNVGVTK